MPKDGSKTRTKILDETLSLVLDNGYAGTTIDHILERTNITKGAFFYHFKSKSDLAYSLMSYFAELDKQELNSALEATKGVKDPVDRLLHFVQFFIDIMSKLDAPYQGCLYASYTYEPDHFSQEIKDIVNDAIILWRKEIMLIMESAAESINLKEKVDLESLADMFTVILEGAFVVARSLNDADLTAKQLIHYRTYLEMIFNKA